MAPEGKLSFEEYFNKYYQQAYGYVFKKVSDSYLAEDLTMDAFVSCYQKFDKFDPGIASFQTWLYVVINNKLKNYYRDNKKVEYIDDPMVFAGTYEDDLTAAEDLKSMRDFLAEGLSMLSETQRQIIIYKYFRGLKSAEIARIMGLTPVNVRVHLSRAVAHLKDFFDSKGVKWEF